MLLRSNFSSFPQYFQNVSNLGVRLHIHSVKGGCSINCFPESANLICRSTDISNCFIESLGIRDNESRLYVKLGFTKFSILQIELLPTIFIVIAVMQHPSHFLYVSPKSVIQRRMLAWNISATAPIYVCYVEVMT